MKIFRETLMVYKQELIKFLTQDQISKDFMEMLEQKK